MTALYDPGHLCSLYIILALGTLSEINRQAMSEDHVVGKETVHSLSLAAAKKWMPPNWPDHEEFFERALAIKPSLRVTISSLQALILLHWYLYTEVRRSKNMQCNHSDSLSLSVKEYLCGVSSVVLSALLLSLASTTTRLPSSTLLLSNPCSLRRSNSCASASGLLSLCMIAVLQSSLGAPWQSLHPTPTHQLPKCERILMAMSLMWNSPLILSIPVPLPKYKPISSPLCTPRTAKTRQPLCATQPASLRSSTRLGKACQRNINTTLEVPKNGPWRERES